MGNRRTAFTDAQVAANMEAAEAALVVAKEVTGGKAYSITATDIGAAFRQFVAQTQAIYGDVNIEYAFSCGSKGKIVCMADARANAAKRLKGKAR